MTVAKALPTDLIDSLLSGYKKPEDLIGEYGLLKQLTKALVERALAAEMEPILVMSRMRLSLTPQATPATVRAARRKRVSFGFVFNY
jgi:putative transposase